MDRNFPGTNTILCITASLSARRAWIEIVAPSSAPYAELSLSARRAWIEIFGGVCARPLAASLSARRAWIEIAVLQLIPLSDPRRSPQGERG